MVSRRIPLFPLNVVLFPGMTLPLHIFEPRYQLMIRRCLEGDRTFGVCLIRSGEEVGAAADPFPVGTTCEILSALPLAEGRMNLSTVGRERFRVVRLYQELEYLEADIEPLTECEEPAPRELTEQVHGAAAEYIRVLLSLGGQTTPDLQLPGDPVVLSYLVGAVLQVPLPVRQELLEEDVTSVRLSRQLSLLESETVRLAQIQQSQQSRQGAARPFQVDPTRISPN